MDIAQTLLEPAAQRCATVDAALAGELAQLDEAIQSMVTSALPRLRRLHSDCVQAREALRAKIEELGPASFDKPKTRSLHGYTVGYRAGQPSVAVSDEVAAIATLRELGLMWALRTKIELDRRALLKLANDQIAQIGGELVPAESKLVLSVDADVLDTWSKLLGDRAERGA